MKRVLALYLLVAACDRTSAPAAPRVPSFTAPLLDGGRLDTSELVGKRPFVLVFWSTWCDPCVAQAPHLVAFHERYRGRAELVSVAVDSTDEHPELRALVAKHRISYPVAVDVEGRSVLPRFSRSTGLPLILVVDREGRVRLTQHNYRPGDERALEAAIEQVVTN